LSLWPPMSLVAFTVPELVVDGSGGEEEVKVVANRVGLNLLEFAFWSS
jgi:hypothetical protein